MGKNIWKFNHYAGTPSKSQWLRHYHFSKWLKKSDYQVRIFAASTLHNTDLDLMENSSAMWMEDDSSGVPFVYIKARKYKGNGKSRILNMIDYFCGVMKAAKHFKKPDIIIGSSVHPLACVAGILLGKLYKVPVISEIRDLWPESIVAYHVRERSSLSIKALYWMEKWIYKESDSIIFTMPGGKKYIIDKGWDTGHGGPVDLNKVYHINNGVDLESFYESRDKSDFHDQDLENPALFKVVYTGSVRLVNEVDKLVDVAMELRRKGQNNIKILIWGGGDYTDKINQRIDQCGLENIELKGRVDKSIIPKTLSQSSLNVFLFSDSPLIKYGLSLNKMFEYFASGKPVLVNRHPAYSLIDQYHCGRSMSTFTPEKMADEIIAFASLSQNDYNRYCSGALLAAQDYDFKELTQKLMNVIEETMRRA